MPQQRLNFVWLLRLRWGALFGQLVAVAVAVALLSVPLPVVPLSAVLGLGVASNLLATFGWRKKSQVPEGALASLLALDVVLLTLLLALSGGPYNPFSTLYLGTIALSVVVLRPGYTFVITALALLGYGLLFLPGVFGPLSATSALSHAEQMRIHLQAMWLSFALAAALIVYFLRRARGALAERETQLVAAQELGARRQRLASLAQLAAGAAHELATPLSTIALVSRELQRRLEGMPELGEDAQLIREQVERCRLILQDMAHGAGATSGEAWSALQARAVAEAAAARFASLREIHVQVDADAEVTFQGPAKALSRALEGLVKNAVQASDAAVALAVVRTREGLSFSVRDEGTGMSSEVLARAGEPFFTTKAPGEGMGLGLFLTRALAEELGGSLTLAPRVPRGIEARLAVPVAE